MKTVTMNAYVGKERLRLAIGGDVSKDHVVRDEGGISMSLVDPVLSVECDGVDFSKIHPDLLALIGVLAFYPALPQTEEFLLRTNLAVSSNVENALRRPWILKGVRVLGSGASDAYVPSINGVISYGGGIDSLAARILFPNLPLVHETPLPTHRTSYSDIVNGLVEADGPENHVVYDNLRQLFTAWGLPLWVAVYIASLIHQPAFIVSGSEMTGTYLLGGVEYKPRHANVWYRVFSTVGIKVLPTSFLSEIGNAQIVAANGRMEDAAYCSTISRKDCDRCTKCLRRRLIRGIFDPGSLSLVDDFQATDATLAFLGTRPLYYGDVFTHAVATHARPTWVSKHLHDLVEIHGKLGFHEAYNPDAFDHFGFPNHLRAQAEIVMQSAGLRPFSASDKSQFTEYRQVPNYLHDRS